MSHLGLPHVPAHRDEPTAAANVFDAQVLEDVEFIPHEKLSHLKWE